MAEAGGPETGATVRGGPPALPENSWDCHIHVFPEPERFGFAPDRLYTPLPVSPSDARAVMRRLGARFAVIQHATPYGSDNDSLIWSVAAMRESAVGVAACLPEQEMRRLDPADWMAAGIAGFRIHAAGPDACSRAGRLLETAAAALAGSPMHVDIHVRGDAAAGLADIVRRLPVPVVLDHFAGMAPIDGKTPPALMTLMEGGNVWLKLSTGYRVPGLDDGNLGETVARLMDSFPTRCLWGSDWPHTPPHPAGDAERLRTRPYREIDTVGLARRTSGNLTDAQRYLLFVGNPGEFYGWALGNAARR